MVLQASRFVAFFNGAAFQRRMADPGTEAEHKEEKVDVDLERLSNLIGKDDSSASQTGVDELFELMCHAKTGGGENGPSAYLALLSHAADQYMKQVYNI